jgi:hypothetical protein
MAGREPQQQMTGLETRVETSNRGLILRPNRATARSKARRASVSPKTPAPRSTRAPFPIETNRRAKVSAESAAQPSSAQALQLNFSTTGIS